MSDLVMCLVVRSENMYNVLARFGNKVEGHVRDVFIFIDYDNYMGNRTGSIVHHRLDIEWRRMEPITINFSDVFGTGCVCSQDIVEFLGNDLSQPEIDCLSMSLCPELPRVASARFAEEMEFNRRYYGLLQQPSTAMMDETTLIYDGQTDDRYDDELFDDELKKFKASRSLTWTFDNIPKSIEISKECCVCMEAEKLLLFTCQHVVCFVCIQKIHDTCPMCRAHVSKESVKRL